MFRCWHTNQEKLHDKHRRKQRPNPSTLLDKTLDKKNIYKYSRLRTYISGYKYISLFVLLLLHLCYDYFQAENLLYSMYSFVQLVFALLPLMSLRWCFVSNVAQISFVTSTSDKAVFSCGQTILMWGYFFAAAQMISWCEVCSLISQKLV